MNRMRLDEMEMRLVHHCGVRWKLEICIATSAIGNIGDEMYTK